MTCQFQPTVVSFICYRPHATEDSENLKLPTERRVCNFEFNYTHCKTSIASR
jgi:hypothetical protein